MGEPWHPADMLRPHRRITGISAVLLPFREGEIDWATLHELLARTVEAKLIPAVNMDTGYVNLLDDETRRRVLRIASEHADDAGFVAGAFVADKPGAKWRPDRYRAQLELIRDHGGTPVVFPSFGLTELDGPGIVDAHIDLARDCDRFIAFELGTQFSPAGRIFPLEVYEGLLRVPQCIGAKHSSLDRVEEWRRLRLRDANRPDFKVFTGNDLAIDMVMYGSDYLLGLSAMAPDVFARRDFYWEIGHPDFYVLNDQLQYLGSFAFRPPIPAYRHTAAQFLHLRGWVRSPESHPKCPQRPASDIKILAALAEGLGLLED